MHKNFSPLGPLEHKLRVHEVARNATAAVDWRDVTAQDGGVTRTISLYQEHQQKNIGWTIAGDLSTEPHSHKYTSAKISLRCDQ